MRRLGEPYRREDRNCWEMRWSEGGRRIKKDFHKREQADQFYHKLYTERNADVLVGLNPIQLKDAVADYLDTYGLRALAKSSRTEARLTLDKFQALLGDVSTKHIGQRQLDAFVRARMDSGASKPTVKKDVSNLHAFIRWASDKKRRYLPADLELPRIKVAMTPVKTMKQSDILTLIRTCAQHSSIWAARVIVSLCTGLRKQDVDGLKIENVNLEELWIDTKSQKTGKVFAMRPLPDGVRPYLRSYILSVSFVSMPMGGLLFPDKNARKEWEAIRVEAKMPDLTRQQLRKTFATMVAMGSYAGAAQQLLEHSSRKITETHYLSGDVLRSAVNRLPVAEWVAAAGFEVKGQQAV